MNFKKGKSKKISYAPSFGITKFTEAITMQILSLINDFDAISCREDAGVDYLKCITGRDIVKVLDPIFLLTKEEWEKIAVIPKCSKPYLLIYCLSFSKYRKLKKLAVDISTKENLDIISINNVSPQEFVGYLLFADFVITDSFHGTSFSLLFKKRHLSYIANRSKGSRIENIMKIYNKENEIIYDIDNYKYNHDTIKNVDICINEMKEQSINYLYKNIKL